MKKVPLSVWLVWGSLVVIWGSSFMLMAIAVNSISPEFTAGARITIAALIIVPVAIIMRRDFPKTLKSWFACCAIGIFSLALPISLITWAQQSIPSGVAGLFMAIIPLTTLPLAHFLLKDERINKFKAIGFVIGFVGVIILIGPNVIMQLGADGQGYAQMACLVAAISLSVGGIIIRVAPTKDPIAAAAVSLLAASIVLLPSSLPAFHIDIPLKIWAVLILLGALSTGYAMIARVYIIKAAGPVFMTAAGYLVPCWALLMGALFLAEPVGVQQIAALVLILAGITITRINPA